MAHGMSEAVSVLVGTTKGAVVVSSVSNHPDWIVHGPLCNGWSITHMIGDAAAGRLYVDRRWRLARRCERTSVVAGQAGQREHGRLDRRQPRRGGCWFQADVMCFGSAAL